MWQGACSRLAQAPHTLTQHHHPMNPRGYTIITSLNLNLFHSCSQVEVWPSQSTRERSYRRFILSSKNQLNYALKGGVAFFTSVIKQYSGAPIIPRLVRLRLQKSWILAQNTGSALGWDASMVCMHRGMLEPRWSGHLTELNKTNVSRQNKDKGVKTDKVEEKVRRVRKVVI